MAPPSRDLVADQVAGLESIVGPLIRGADRLALVDFPNHGNVGDSAIWMGEQAMLRRLGRPRPAYSTTIGSHVSGQLRRAVGGEGTILIHGGGNFGDIWTWHQAFRERILREFRDIRIIQLPQTLWFADEKAPDHLRRLIDVHPRFVLLVRDQRSLEFARTQFDCEVALCPDSAFALGHFPRPFPSGPPLVWLSRRDREAVEQPDRLPAGAPDPVDWYLDDPGSYRLAGWLASRVARHVPLIGGRCRPALQAYYDAVAGHRVMSGVRMLAGARCVVTNRLHVHVFCLQLGIRHFLSDNTYGKVRSYYDTWTHSSPLATWCASEADALSKALAWLAGEP